MASVYLAEDEVLGETTVALKTLKQSGQLSEAAAERFLREVRLTHKIHHENVVRTFDFGQDGEIRFYTMEYLQGQTLARFSHDEKLPLPIILRLAVQICRGLGAIHAVGVIHRDLKPDNIMVVDAMRVKITDFGVARGEGSMMTVAAEEIIGTIAYLAPETLIGRKATSAVDYYSLGAILYELLTGCLPIEDESPARLIVRKIEELPLDPRSLDPTIPGWLAEGVLDLLEPDPQERMRSVKNFVQTLLNNAPGDDRSDVITASLGIQISDIPTGIAERPSVVEQLQPLWRHLASTKRLAVTVLFVLLAIPLSLTDMASRFELLQLDTLFKYRGTQSPASDVAIIAIDEPSYLNLKVPMGDAWPRALHTKLLERLSRNGAKRIVFDVLFVAPSGDLAADASFAEALRLTPTVLGASIGLTQQSTANGSFTLEQMTRPLDLFEKHSVGIGVVDFPQTYGRIRSFYTERSPLFPDVPSLAEVAADGVIDKDAVKPVGRDVINYYGPAASIPRFSYHDVIADEERIPSVAFKDKIVFVGLNLRSRTGPSQREAFENPFDSRVFGTEIHATATSNLIKQDWIRRASAATEAFACGVVVAGAIIILISMQGIRALLTLGGWSALVLALQFTLFSFNLWVALATPLVLGVGLGAVARIGLARRNRRQGRRWA
jgi:serine/threonine protein kinase